MSKILGHLEPQAVFHYFEEIAAIPHGSRNTKKIADYCEQFAKDRGLQHTRDASDNVIIVKPAAKGYETAAPVVLQGHLDMVCEKAPGCTKDMETEGLDLVEENGWVYARGTTLGGDDGIAVAMMLALLDEKDLPAPRLECIITSDEEIGMLGAAVLQPTLVTGRNMINLDSEAEGVFTVSCAGGNRTYCRLPIQRETVTGQTVTLRIAELVGGHSGVEIDKGRANADMLLGRLVMAARRDAPCRLISLTGGSKDNAIPNEATAQLLCEDLPALERLAAAWQSQLRHEYAPAEPDLTITVTPNEKTACAVLTEESAERVLCMLLCVPNGIQAMSGSLPGLVQTSLNLGILTTEDDAVELHFGVRSSVASPKGDADRTPNGADASAGRHCGGLWGLPRLGIPCRKPPAGTDVRGLPRAVRRRAQDRGHPRRAGMRPAVRKTSRSGLRLHRPGAAGDPHGPRAHVGRIGRPGLALCPGGTAP